MESRTTFAPVISIDTLAMRHTKIADNAKVHTNSKAKRTDVHMEDNMYKTDNKDAIQSIASKPEVGSAARSVAKDDRIRSAAWNTYRRGGNDRHTVRVKKQLAGALAQNKAVRAATVSVAKDEKVQKAAYQTVKTNATKKNISKLQICLTFNV
eukprot:859145_1